MQEAYSAAIRWDEEAGVWYVSETDFPGLVAEAETQHGLTEKIRLLIPELHDANRHLMHDMHDLAVSRPECAMVVLRASCRAALSPSSSREQGGTE